MVAVRFSGNAAPALRRIQSALSQLARGEVTRTLAAKFAPLAEQLVDASWSRRASPSGRAWPARKGRGGHPLLQKSGRLRNSVKSVVRGNAVSVTVGASYAKFHQFGTRRMRARPMLPQGAMPPAWKNKLAHSTREQLRGAFGRG